MSGGLEGGGGGGIQAQLTKNILTFFSCFSPQIILQNGYNGFISRKTIISLISRGGNIFQGIGGPITNSYGNHPPLWIRACTPKTSSRIDTYMLFHLQN